MDDTIDLIHQGIREHVINKIISVDLRLRLHDRIKKTLVMIIHYPHYVHHLGIVEIPYKAHLCAIFFPLGST